MSFADSEDSTRAPGSARTSKARTPRTPRGSVDDAFQQECHKIQAAVQKIQQHAADVRKEANLLSNAASQTAGKGKAKVHAAYQESKVTNETALVVLQTLSAMGQGLSAEEQNNRRFMTQKLTENLQVSMKAVESAWLAYEAAEADNARKLAASLNRSKEPMDDKKTPLVTAGDPSIDPALAPSHEAADLEAGQRSATQMQKDATAAETEIHAAIADEYARELNTLNNDVRALQRVMVDLAEHATAQGEVLDNLESNLSAAADSTGQATEEVATSAEQQQTRSKRFMWILVAAGSIAAVGALLT